MFKVDQNHFFPPTGAAICSRKFVPVIWFLLFILLLFGLLLWLPMRVVIDTQQNVYKFSWQGIFASWVVPEKEGFRWFFRLFFWQKEWLPDKKQTKKENSTQNKKSTGTKQRFRFSIKFIRALTRNLTRAIKVQRLRVNWDTGDFVLNAWLYPAFRSASKGKRQLFVNFMGEQDLTLRLQTRLGYLAIAAVRVFINYKNY